MRWFAKAFAQELMRWHALVMMTLLSTWGMERNQVEARRSEGQIALSRLKRGVRSCIQISLRPWFKSVELWADCRLSRALNLAAGHSVQRNLKRTF